MPASGNRQSHSSPSGSGGLADETALAPILTRRSSSVVIDHCNASASGAGMYGELAGLLADPKNLKNRAV
jgi:hypothetical protein